MPISDDVLSDIRPLSLRRKRRASSTLGGSSAEQEFAESAKYAEQTEIEASDLKHKLKPALLRDNSAAHTPRTKKRVRFSYPPDAPKANAESTGITPFVARTSLVDNADLQTGAGVSTVRSLSSRLLRQPPKRRQSASAMPSYTADNSLQLSSRNVEIQFTPIRQILSERTKRRLTRNRMSETMNEIEVEQRSHKAQEQELVDVKKEVEGLRESSDLSSVQSDRIRELEGEIERLKEQLANGSSNEAADSIGDDVDDIVLLDSNCGSPMDSMPMTPTTPYSSSSAATSAPETPCTSTSVQTDFTFEAMDKVHAHFISQLAALSNARLELERIMPGETSLPLSAPTEHLLLSGAGIADTPLESEDLSSNNMLLADARPLLDAVLDHIRSMHARISQTTKDLSKSEEQRINVVGNFRAALKQLDEARQARAVLIAAAQTRPDSSSRPKKASESRRITDEDVRACELEEATKQLKKLQKNAALYEHDRAKLIAALNKYRAEIKDMESLITTLETEHALALQDFKEESSAKLAELVAEHAQAVDDLEARVAAETRGRREAEAEIDKVMGRWAEQRLKGEREVGTLNVRLADLDEEVRHRGHEVGHLKVELAELQDHVRDFVGHIGTGFHPYSAETGLNSPAEEPSLPVTLPTPSKGSGHQPPRVGKFGLLTPHIEGGRFKDIGAGLSPDLSSDASMGGDLIPGEVELERGKTRHTRRHDSGIEIVMEAENEE